MRRYLSSAYLSKAILVVALCSLMSGVAMSAQTLFQDQMTNGAGWSTISLNNSDNFATFGFDYSNLPSTNPLNPGGSNGGIIASGIPEAPNSQPGDTGTSGLLMVVNWDDELTNILAAYPTGQNFTGSYTLQFDMWLNTNGSFPFGGSGSTEMGGGSVGFDNNTTNPLSGAGFHGSSEGQTTVDYRLYANNERQDYDTHTGQTEPIGGNNAEIPIENDLFDDKWVRVPDNKPDGNPEGCFFDGECNGDNANYNAYMRSIFAPPPANPANIFSGTKETPIEQRNAFPDDQNGKLMPGSLGFQWVTMKFTVDGDGNTVFVQATSSDTGLTADIGTFTDTNNYVDQSDTTPILTSFDGNISLLYRDPFASLAPPGLERVNFGIFDNILVTAPDAGVAGDFNENGTVDAADYTVWLDNLGSAAALANDDGLGGTVGQAHYDLWKANFGNSLGTSNSSSVPEPTSLLLAALAAVGILVRRRR